MSDNYISIEGNIGAGKTSLAKLLAAKHHANLLLEGFEYNPYLSRFYLEPEKYAFKVELSFLADRYQQMRQKLTGPDLFSSLLISDYMFSKSLIFARINLNEEEFRIYNSLFNIIYTSLPKPDLVVFLYVEIEKLKENIKKRGRQFEKGISTAYLARVRDSYLEFFKQHPEQKTLVIDITEMDFIENNRNLQLLSDAVFGDYKPGITRLYL